MSRGRPSVQNFAEGCARAVENADGAQVAEDLLRSALVGRANASDFLDLLHHRLLAKTIHRLAASRRGEDRRVRRRGV